MATSLLAFLASRIVVLVAVAVAAAVRGDDLMSALRAWDGDWYLGAAEEYTTVPPDPVRRPWQSNVAFLPVLPLTIRIVAALPRVNLVDAGVATVHLYGLVAAVGLGSLAHRFTDRESGRRSLWLFWLFPGAAVFSLIYAEVALVAWAILTILALLDHRWLLAGIAAALGAATRPTGVVLILCCLWAAGEAVRRQRSWSAVIAPLLAPIALVGYFTYLWRSTGDALFWFHTQTYGWQARFDFGARVADQVLRVLRDPLDTNATVGLDLLGLVAAAVGLTLVLMWRRRLCLLVVYTLGMVAMPLLTQTGTAGGTRPRFIAVAFPMFMALAVRLGALSSRALAIGSAALLAATAVVYTTPLWVIP